ncbi:MAG: rhomboid family intramembrane serine protease [Bacteroidales bacterium]
MMYSNRSGFFSSLPVVTKNLLLINVIFWIASITLPSITLRFFGRPFDLIDWLGMHFILSDKFNAAQMVSYMFLHDTRSFTHLFFNMFSVFMFGRVLESVWGPKRFLTFYLFTGIGAGVIQQLTWVYDMWPIITANVPIVDSMHAIIPKSLIFDQAITIGASGAVFGILLGFGMMFPNAPLYLMFIPIPIKAKYLMIGYGLIELFMGVASFRGDNVAHFAHLGGMLFAYIMIRMWKNKSMNDGNYYR